jgi:hypothetical protein
MPAFRYMETAGSALFNGGKGRKRVPCSKEASRDVRTMYATGQNGFKD